MLVQRHHRQGRLLFRRDRVVELDTVVGEVRADPFAEQVVRDTGQQAGGDAQAGEAERDVRRATAGRDLEVVADRRGHQVDEGLTGDGDHAGRATGRGRVGGQPAGSGRVEAVTADLPGSEVSMVNSSSSGRADVRRMVGSSAIVAVAVWSTPPLTG